MKVNSNKFNYTGRYNRVISYQMQVIYTCILLFFYESNQSHDLSQV